MNWSYCNNLCPSSSNVLVTTDGSKLSQRPKFSYLCQKQKRGLHESARRTKVHAYYGLKTPPYKLDALEPYMSQRTLEKYWGEHHRGYVEGLNKQLEKNDILYGYTMDELLK